MTFSDVLSYLNPLNIVKSVFSFLYTMLPSFDPANSRFAYLQETFLRKRGRDEDHSDDDAELSSSANDDDAELSSSANDDDAELSASESEEEESEEAVLARARELLADAEYLGIEIDDPSSENLDSGSEDQSEALSATAAKLAEYNALIKKLSKARELAIEILEESEKDSEHSDKSHEDSEDQKELDELSSDDESQEEDAYAVLADQLSAVISKVARLARALEAPLCSDEALSSGEAGVDRAPFTQVPVRALRESGGLLSSESPENAGHRPDFGALAHQLFDVDPAKDDMSVDSAVIGEGLVPQLLATGNVSAEELRLSGGAFVLGQPAPPVMPSGGPGRDVSPGSEGSTAAAAPGLDKAAAKKDKPKPS